MDTVTPPKRSNAFLSAVLVAGLLLLLVTLDARRRAAVAQLEQLSVRLSQLTGTTTGRAQAQEVLEQVRKLYRLPTDVEPRVATIVDAEGLAKGNDFYKRAKNGDSLIITPTRAILFRSSTNMIVDVVPVQLTSPAEARAQLSAQRAAAGTQKPAAPAPEPKPEQ
ncbi:MAG: Uncharacterized protein Greene041619_380 [Candidatus Peregrinibacteria bacterium Greene0416_19]|nr:MAG: Uncharacterized protein Greene041619_380 [Candidatus Peregrinibacteria bacterium Greene0416_19]